MLLERWDPRNEADEPWIDFFGELVSLYPTMNSSEYALLADMQKGISKAQKLKLPNMCRTICYEHMKLNVAKIAGNAMLQVFEKAAYATRPDVFDKAMEKATPKLRVYLTDTYPFCEWAKLFRPHFMRGKMASSVR